jgi:hypothetical protein
LLAQIPESLGRLGVDGVRDDVRRDDLLGAEDDRLWVLVEGRDVVVLQVDTADVGEQWAGRGEDRGAGRGRRV